jgi:hypothetical protein
MEQSLLKKLVVTRLLKILRFSYGTQKFTAIRTMLYPEPHESVASHSILILAPEGRAVGA